MGGVILLPTEIEPGGTFQLAIVTTGRISGVSSDINVYNAFVMAQAKAMGLDVVNGQAVTWTAIVSTTSVDARDNAVQSAPVFNGNGDPIALTPGGLWNSRLDFLDNPIDPFGGPVPRDGYVWTGSDATGRKQAGAALGSAALVRVGDPTSRFTGWMTAAVNAPSAQLRVYALSSPIRAVVVPEPSSLGLLALGVVPMAAYVRRRRS